MIGVADAYAGMNQTKLANNLYGKCLDRCDATTQPLIIMRLADNYVKRDEKHSAVALLHDAAQIAQHAGHVEMEIAYLCKLHVLNSQSQDAHGLQESERAILDWAARTQHRGTIDAAGIIEAALAQASQILVEHTLTAEEGRLARFNAKPSLQALDVVTDTSDSWDSVSAGGATSGTATAALDDGATDRSELSTPSAVVAAVRVKSGVVRRPDNKW